MLPQDQACLLFLFQLMDVAVRISQHLYCQAEPPTRDSHVGTTMNNSSRQAKLMTRLSISSPPICVVV